MTTPEADQFGRGEAIEVPVGKIESELSSLWRQAAAAQAQPVSRACLWNLIVRVEGEQMFVAAKRLIDDVSAVVPARVIVMHVEPERDDRPIRAFVEANWRKSGPGLSGSDEVTLHATGEATARVPSLVRSLLVTDAPTAMFWWGRPPGERAPAQDLLADIDRLIVDSRKLPSEERLGDYDRLATNWPDLELVDCAWLGVRPLRGLCAGLFDPPRDPGRLATLDRARVVSGVKGCQSRGLLTLGWLASQLGWRGMKRDGGTTEVRRWRAQRPNGGDVTIELETRLGGSSHGVAAIELQAGEDRWTLERENQCIQSRGPGLPPRGQPVRTHTDAELVISGLGPRGRDPVFRAALTEAVHLVEAK